jgi:putative holliday junction resolvase
MSSLPVVPRVLGVDFGRARIGVAVSDELGMLAHPLETIAVKDLKGAAKRVAALAVEKKAARVVLGLPRHMNGELGTAADEAKAFGDKLRPLLPCPLVLWDERLTTTAAHRALRDAGQRTRNTRGFVDQVAAQMILQGYLDSQQSAGAAMFGDDLPQG